jgi:glutathione S-transferase
MTMLKLYDHPLSPYSQKVKIALLEKGLECEILVPNAFATGAADGEFASASPRGEVPLLIHTVAVEEVCVYDSTVILEYLEDVWPTPAMLPAKPADRARVRMLEDVMDTHVEAIIWGLAEIKYFGRASGAEAEQINATAAQQIAQWYRWLDEQLGERTWFNGDNFGWGDLAVIPCVANAVNYGLVPEVSSRLAGWLQRVNQVPSVSAVMATAAENSFDNNAEGMAAARGALEAGLFKREYRDHRLEWMVKTAGLDIVSAGLAKGNVRFTTIFAD